jgi:hypothetical protein
MIPEVSTSGWRSLRQLFDELVWRHFVADVKLEEPTVVQYVSNLMVEFCDMKNVYRIHDILGQPVQDVGKMLIESDPLLQAASFDREREVRKHVGDYTLFMSGLFPESLHGKYRAKRDGIDYSLDFVRTGKESYAVVSAFDQFEYRSEAALFRRLSENFERCVSGLNMVKQDLDEFQLE